MHATRRQQGAETGSHTGAGVVTVLMLLFLVGASGPVSTEAGCWAGAGVDCRRSLAGVAGVRVSSARPWPRGADHRDRAGACRWSVCSVTPVRTVADALLKPPRAPTDQHCV